MIDGLINFQLLPPPDSSLPLKRNRFFRGDREMAQSLTMHTASNLVLSSQAQGIQRPLLVPKGTNVPKKKFTPETLRQKHSKTKNKFLEKLILHL